MYKSEMIRMYGHPQFVEVCSSNLCIPDAIQLYKENTLNGFGFWKEHVLSDKTRRGWQGNYTGSIKMLA